MLPAAFASRVLSSHCSSGAQSQTPVAEATSQCSEGPRARGGSRSTPRVTGISNTGRVPMNTVRLRQHMKEVNMSVERLSTLTGCAGSSMRCWVSGATDVPWDVIERIGSAVHLAPESLGTKRKTFEPSKFAYYLKRRGMSLERLLKAGRFESYSYSLFYKWLAGTETPSPKAVSILEQGLSLKPGALTDGPLEQVSAFTAADIEQWPKASPAMCHPTGPLVPPSIGTQLREWASKRGMTWHQFSAMVPDYSANTVWAWMRDRQEPSERGIDALEKVMGLATGTLVKRNNASKSRFKSMANSSRIPSKRVGRALSTPGNTAPPEDRPHSPLLADTLSRRAEAHDELVPVLFEVLAHDIRTPQQWVTSFDYLVPHLLVKLSAWPQGRDLYIDSPGRFQHMHVGDGRDPAPVRMYQHRGHYYGVQYRQPVAVSSDGDGFFRAVLVSLGYEQVAFIERLQLGRDRSERVIIEAMRSQLAQYLFDHQAHVAMLLQAWTSQPHSAM